MAEEDQEEENEKNDEDQKREPRTEREDSPVLKYIAVFIIGGLFFSSLMAVLFAFADKDVIVRETSAPEDQQRLGEFAEEDISEMSGTEQSNTGFFHIVSPQPDSTIYTSNNVLAVRIFPPDAGNYKWALYIDGQLLDIVENVPRIPVFSVASGEHTATAVLVSVDGREVMASDEVKFVVVSS